MSRVGKKEINIPKGIDIKKENGRVIVKKDKQELTLEVLPDIEINISDGKITLKRKSEEKRIKSLHGLYRALINNMIKGLEKGFEKKLEIVGVGYRVQPKGKGLTFQLGYSHSIDFDPPQGITFIVDGQNKISVKGFDKQLVGDIAAKIRNLRGPEPYKGKGIKYENEIIKKKAGKAGAKV
jgi:large subunit ribosomal protein L6